jgi:hypothetical protein
MMYRPQSLQIVGTDGPHKKNSSGASTRRISSLYDGAGEGT